MLVVALDHVGPGHGIFSHLNVLLILGARESTLVGHTHGSEVK